MLFDTALKGRALEADQAGVVGKFAEARDHNETEETAAKAPEMKKEAAAGMLADRAREDRRAERPQLARKAMPAPPAPSAKPAETALPAKEEAEAAPADAAPGFGGGKGIGALPAREKLAQEALAKRKEVRQFYRRLDQTEELAENNYHHLRSNSRMGTWWRPIRSGATLPRTTARRRSCP